MILTWKNGNQPKKKTHRRRHGSARQPGQGVPFLSNEEPQKDRAGDLEHLSPQNYTDEDLSDQTLVYTTDVVSENILATDSTTAIVPQTSSSHVVIDERLLSTPGGSSTAHPFINDCLKQLRIPGLTDIDVFCQWSALDEVRHSSVDGQQWSQQVNFLWGKVLWDWANSDPLIFYTVLQAVLDKRYNITGTRNQEDLAAINSRMIPLLSARISNPRSLNGLEAMAITGLTFMAMRGGDFATAQIHQRAIQRIFDLTHPDRHVWLYVYWASLRLSAASFLAPFLRKEIPRDWPVNLLSKEQLAKAQRSALRDIRTFGNVFALDHQDFYNCFRQLHEIAILQDSHSDSVDHFIVPVYSVCYDICSLHAKVHAPRSHLAPDHSALLELVAIAVKCCAWNRASFVGPHGGKVQQAILGHATTLSAALPAFDTAALAATFGLNPRALLWLFLTLSAEAYWYLPETRGLWLSWLRSATKLLLLTSQSAFNRALAGFPCTGDKYWKRMVRAWQDAGGPSRNNASWQREMEDNRRGMHGDSAFGKYIGILNFQVDVE